MAFIDWCFGALLLAIAALVAAGILAEIRSRHAHERWMAERGRTIAWRSVVGDPSGGMVVAVYMNGRRSLYWLAETDPALDDRAVSDRYFDDLDSFVLITDVPTCAKLPWFLSFSLPGHRIVRLEFDYCD